METFVAYLATASLTIGLVKAKGAAALILAGALAVVFLRQSWRGSRK